MTAVIHHGPPGSYKSFSIVQNVVVPALKKGRTVVTNVRGLDDINRIAKAMDVEIPEEAQLIHVKHDSNDGFEHMARFFQWVPVGALIVMDEGQRVYPTRLKSLSVFDTPKEEKEFLDSGVQRPANVENAFDQHRHMNWDIYISTTNISKIHKEVRAVAEYAFRHRDMSGVVPWWKNTWREFKHDAETSGKSVSHYIGTPERRKADARVFSCYQSTATGEAKSSNENKNLFSDPKLRIFLGIIALAFSLFLYNLFKVIDNFDEDGSLPLEAVSPSYVGVVDYDGSGDGDTLSRSNDADLNANIENQFIDIIGDRSVYYTGTFIVHNFELISKDDVIHVTSRDFEAAGYSVSKLSNCLVSLATPSKTHFALCSPEPVEGKSDSQFAQVPFR